MRRIVVLALACAAISLVLVARLAQIQIGERDIWAGEAARLARAGALDPYRRGTIYDAAGRVLSRDHATYRLELSYRDFRRHQPLGLVAHARSALEARAVPLPEAAEALLAWAFELVDLSPRELASFAAGGELETEAMYIAETRDPRRARRGQRASDVSFYIGRLLDLSRSERSRLRDLLRGTGEGSDATFLELFAGWRGLPLVEAERELTERVEKSIAYLRLLAEKLDEGREPLSEQANDADPFESLVADLERVRSTVEELVASNLFREAMGFSPGRIDPDTLFATIDLAWIARPLYWDEDRLDAWTIETRRRWLSWRDHYAVPHLLVEFIARGELERDPEHFFDLLRTVYMEPAALEAALDREPVRGVGLAVLSDLPRLFSVAASNFRLRDEELAGELGATRAERWSALLPLADLVDVTNELGLPDERMERSVGRLRRALARPDNLSLRNLELLTEVLVPRWEARYQEALSSALSAAAAEVGARGELAPNGRLSLDPERRDRALETLRDVLRDYGSRTLPVEERPDYEVVYLLARLFESEGLAGFRSVDARVRVRENTVAAELVGGVSAIGIEAIQRQRRSENRVRELRGRVRSEEEDGELAELIGDLLLRSEWRGVSGVEGEWDAVLHGKNGYRELRGLEDVYGRGRTAAVLSRREDGLDIQLSIEAELQGAVERMLEDPEYDRDDPLVDRDWFAEPVGAIVMLDASGRVVVAASVPNENTEAAETERADRSVRLDRTLRKPAFQPPGSVFKPFVAAWALDRLGLDPAVTVECARRGGPAEYGGVRCWFSSGHGSVDLSEALKVSCNCYFAWLGEQYPSARSLRLMANTFGFGQPTGLRRGTSRSGLFEEYVPDLFSGRLTRHEARLAGNGLAVVEATPMQVARAMLALGTGELHTLSNVVRVGDEGLAPAPPDDTGLSAETLDLVRGALRRVAGEEGGTAHRALNPTILGTEVVVKTGSADLEGRARVAASPDRRPSKHTWVAGWLPPERPVMAFAVFLDRSHATSSHTAVYVARQFLRLAEVREWLASRGVVYRH